LRYYRTVKEIRLKEKKMKFLKRNILSIAAMVILFTLVMMDPSYAAGNTIFDTVKAKLNALFRNAKLVVFVIGGFGLIALAFQAIFGKVKWPRFAALGFGLAVVAAAGAVVNYAVSDDGAGDYTKFSDSLSQGANQ
jgi:type IV secretory pathway VirB2 component (pilin)